MPMIVLRLGKRRIGTLLVGQDLLDHVVTVASVP